MTMNSSGSHEIEIRLQIEREVEEMEAVIERGATSSLKRINRCFESSGQSLDEDFRQYILRISNDRLSATYTKVQMEIKWGKNQQIDDSNDQMLVGGLTDEPLAQPRNSLEGVDLLESHRGMTFDFDINRLQNGSGNSTSVKNERTNSIDNTVNVKSEVDATQFDAVVEIFDSSDEENIDEAIGTHSRDIKSEREEGANVVNGKTDANENQSNAPMNRNNNEVSVKEELDIEPKQEVLDEAIPIRIFNPNNVSLNGGYSSNNDAAGGNGAGSSLPRKRCGTETGRVSDETLAPKPSCSKDAKRYKCQHCDYGTDHKGHLNRHLRTHTKERPYRCSHCAKCFADPSTLNRHEKTHKDEFPFHCSNCFRGFFQNDEKEAHEMICTYRRYECFICEYTTINKTSLVRHMRTHSGKKPYRCSRCYKGFTTLWNLNLHMTTHKDRKLPFHCKGCFRQFLRKCEMQDHERRYRNRRYECHLCKKFITVMKTKMEIHMRSHSGEKPFRCEICMKCFNEKNHLKRHLNTVHSRRI